MEVSATIQFINALLAGIAIVFGILSLVLATSGRLKSTFFYFGLIAIFAGFYYLLIGMYTGAYYILDSVGKDYGSTLLFIALCSYIASFSLFPFFICSYSGFCKPVLKWSITSLMAISVLMLLVWGFNDGVQYWNIVAHVSTIGIIVYGLLASRYLMLKGQKRSGKIVFALFALFGLLIFEDIVHVHLTEYYPFDLPNGIMPLDYYLLFFIAFMGSEIYLVFKRSMDVEHQLNMHSKRYAEVIGNITLLTIEVNSNGQLIKVNPYFAEITGYKSEDLQCEDWVKLIVPENEIEERKKIYQSISPESRNLSYYGSLLTKSGELKKMSWTVVARFSETNEYKGIIGFGLDITERENAYVKIQELKDKLELENRSLKSQISDSISNCSIICESSASVYAYEKAIEVAKTDSIVLLEGETGVGKEVFAKLIHQESLRSDKEMITINCSAIPKDLIESELFGHEKGAFTGASKLRKGKFELASGGTLFLDEIGELPLEVQPKLLRVLQDGMLERVGGEKSIDTDVRIIVATNRVLKQEVKLGNFRKDLYYRLNVYPITIPPLRKRKEDIPVLTEYFTNLYSEKYNKGISAISENTHESFLKYSWPGNIRELKNVIERAVINNKSEVLKTYGLLEEVKANQVEEKLSDLDSLEEVERKHISEVLESVNWKIHGANGAAEILKMNPSTLRSRMKKLNIVKVPILN